MYSLFFALRLNQILNIGTYYMVNAKIVIILVIDSYHERFLLHPTFLVVTEWGVV